MADDPCFSREYASPADHSQPCKPTGTLELVSDKRGHNPGSTEPFGCTVVSQVDAECDTNNVTTAHAPSGANPTNEQEVCDHISDCQCVDVPESREIERPSDGEIAELGASGPGDTVPSAHQPGPEGPASTGNHDDLFRILQSAVQADRGHNYKDALAYYREGLPVFDGYLKEKEKKGTIGPSFSSLRRKYQEFSNRREQIESCLRTPGSCETLGTVWVDVGSQSTRTTDTKDLMACRECFLTTPKHKLKDVLGLRALKLKLTEGIILPFKFPSLFSGSRRRIFSYGHFLFGPAGTGKTHLALAVGGELEGCKVFHAHIGDFLGRNSPTHGHRGVRLLFELAILHQPSLVIIDELESFGKDLDTVSRSILTELMVQLHNINQHSIAVIAISNAPWRLSSAVRKRFCYKLYARLPDGETRYEMIKRMIDSSGESTQSVSENDLRELAVRTQGCSGSDLQSIVCSARMAPLREIAQATHFTKITEVEEGKEVVKYMPCAAGTEGAEEILLDQIISSNLPLIERPMTLEDMLQTQTKPSVSEEELQKFEVFAETYTSVNPYDEERRKVNEAESLKVLSRNVIQIHLPERVSLESAQTLELPRSLLLYVLLRD